MCDLIWRSAADMAVEIRHRNLSPRELVKAYLDRIEQVNPDLNALVYVDKDSAVGAAEEAEELVRKGGKLGPLHGVPLTIKSSVEVAGWACEAGSRLRKDQFSARDAPLVERLRKAGAILLGSSNAPEMLMSYETDNVLYGRANNPWDRDRTPGGSSGGESAAIAAGMSAGGVGSDGGGSIRVPAHFAGICGLKPTPGRVPASGHFPPSLGPFALIGVVGPMARTVEDLRLLFEVMAGPDDGDPSSAPVPVRDVSDEELRTVCVGWFEDDGITPVAQEIRECVRRAAGCLEQDGLRVEPLRPSGLERAHQLWWNIFGRAGALLLEPTMGGREAELSPLLKEFLGIAAASPPLNVDELMATWIERDQLRSRLLGEMGQARVLLCPVCSIPAFRHGEREWTVDGKRVKYLDAMRYAQWVNILGCPAATVPVGRSREGLPIGIQIVGRPFEEEIVLAIALRVEKRCESLGRPPV
jgi:Asp-tRNA(Asn)/Glu-tRNA(Gln) amidotransferase A subunit family amidase